jgi:DNA-binding MurR/RpiR family transcriptional regulator
MKPTNASTAYEASSPEVAFAQSALGQELKRVLGAGSASSRSIADFVLRNPVRVTAFGIEELAEHCAVSNATASRFARDIGFANYAAMRGAIAATMQGILQPVEKLRSNIERGHDRSSPAVESLEYVVANIGATAQALAAADVEKVVQKLTSARTVYVMGFGLSSHLAGLLSLHLQPFCQHVVEVAGHGGTEVAAGHLANITPDDVLVVISFPRYALDVIRLAGFARSRSACIVSLTDSPASPLAELADVALFAQATHPVLPSSSSAALALIEALVATLMVSNKDNVEKAARLTEAISAYLYGAEATRVKSKKSR